MLPQRLPGAGPRHPSRDDPVRDPQAAERGGVFGEPVLGGDAAESAAGAGGEQRLAWLAAPLGHLGAERRGGFAGERGGRCLRPLPVKEMRAPVLREV